MINYTNDKNGNIVQLGALPSGVASFHIDLTANTAYTSSIFSTDEVLSVTPKSNAVYMAYNTSSTTDSYYIPADNQKYLIIHSGSYFSAIATADTALYVVTWV